MYAVQLYLALLQDRRAGRCAGQRVRLVRLVVMGHQPTLATHTLTVVTCIVGCPALSKTCAGPSFPTDLRIST